MNRLEALRSQNDRLQQSLPASEQAAMRRISNYISGWKVNAYDAQCIRRDLLGMAQEAAARGETLADAIGPDERAFCTAVVQNARPRSWAEHTLFMGCQVLGMLLLFFLANAFVLWPSAASLFQVRVPELLFYLLYSLAAAFFNHYLLGRLALLPAVLRLLPVALILAGFVIGLRFLSSGGLTITVNRYVVSLLLGSATPAVYLLREWYIEKRMAAGEE